MRADRARESLLTSKVALEGERKHVTVLFADLKGSTEMLVHRDPEDARRILDPVLELMMEAVHRYDGTVNQVMGDGIMALFGAPVAQEDHAVRACYAALQMQERTAHHAHQVQQGEGVLVQIRVGLNSGEVVVRSVGSDVRLDYSAVGEVTHLAARMEQLARPGAVLLTASTAALARDHVTVQSLGDMEVKGLARPLPVYQLVGKGAARASFDTDASRRRTPFVGRDGEVRRLRDIAGRARRGGGRIAAVIGGAGLGKSRLLHEFIHGSGRRGWRIVSARASLLNRATPYSALVDVLRSYFGVSSTDEADHVRRAVNAALGARGGGLEATMPAMLALMDIPPHDPAWEMLDPAERRRRTIDGVAQLFMREATVQPLMLVIEDLHWIDRESDAVLARLAAEMKGVRLVMLLSYRPEHELSWRRSETFAEVRLAPLSAEGVEQLLSQLLGDKPGLKEVRRVLSTRTEGNPFFVEEMLRELMETGVLVREHDGYRVGGDIARVRVPATVHAVLASRIDRLAPSDKAVLQTASVLGETVPVRILEAIGHLAGDELRDAMSRLQQAEFMYPEAPGADALYSFKHALTRDVVYGTLLKQRRRLLHGQIVGVIEQVYVERIGEQIERLAHHAVQGELWDKSIDYLREAGAKAASRGALVDSINRYEEALNIVGRLPSSVDNTRRAIDVRLDFHVPLFPLGQTARLLELYTEAEQLARGLDDMSRLGRITYRLGAYCWVGADYARGIAHARRAIEVAEVWNNRELRVAASHVLAMNHEGPGEYQEAIDLLLGIVEGPDAEVAKTRRDVTVPTYTAACAWLAACFAEVGEFDRAVEWGDRGVDSAETSQHALGRALACTLRAYAALYQGDWTTAVRWSERSVRLCDDKGLHGYRPTAYSTHGAALSGAGRSQEALLYLEQAVKLHDAHGIKTQLAHWCTRWAEGLLRSGSLDEALSVAERARSLALAHGERGNEARALFVIAEVGAGGAPSGWTAALQNYARGGDITRKLGMRPLHARCLLGLAKLNRRTGKREQAQEHFDTATTMYHEMGMTYWLEQAERQCGKLR